MDIVLCIFIFTSILLEWVLFYSNFSFVTFVKSNANALLSAEPTKMRQSTIVCALAEGLFGYRRSVCCLGLHTPQTADIFQQKFRRLQWWRTLKIFSFSPICNPSLSFLNCLHGNVAHSRKYLLKRNHHLKLSGTPLSSRYFLRASSRSCSVGAVLYVV